MYNPWFRWPLPTGQWAKHRNNAVMPPWSRSASRGESAYGIAEPYYSGRPAGNPDHSHTSALIPPGVRLVADLRVSRPPVPNLPESYVAWSPDGRYLLYIGGPGPGGEEGPLMLLDINEPAQPRPVAQRPFHGGLAWHPEGQSFVYTGMYHGPDGRSEPTIYQQRLAGGEPVNLLPPEVTAPLKVAFIHRWLDDHTLAFDESVGTAMRLALLLDAAKHSLIANPELVATMFSWAPPGNRLAGQGFQPLPTSFWLWDRMENRFLRSPVPEENPPLPGMQQFFEAWSPDGRSALFTAWSGAPYDSGSKPALYRLDPVTGQTALLSENAALAAWSDDWIAYVRLEPSFTFVMTRASDNQVLWTDDLGSLPQMDWDLYPWTYWPKIAGRYVVYRTTAGDWRVSRTDRKEVHRIYRGESVSPFWSPQGEHLALLHTNAGGALAVLENPLWQPPMGSFHAEAANPSSTLPPERLQGMALGQALATKGNHICVTGEARINLFLPPDTPSYPLVTVHLLVPECPVPIFLQPSEQMAHVDVHALIRAAHQQLIRVRGTTQGIDPTLGPVITINALPGMIQP